MIYVVLVASLILERQFCDLQDEVKNRMLIEFAFNERNHHSISINLQGTLYGVSCTHVR